ncbi:hypothetical protein [robinz microvirus RP_163]|nr:hypothetical protein [robinz microvirus RP_37]UDN67875.1 hypothetical protein [robinz microvirus RP_163]
MANIYSIRDRSLNCDICCFISDDNGTASSLLITYALQRPASSRQLDLYAIAEVQMADDYYRVFDFVESQYVRSYSEPKVNENEPA